MEKTRCTWCLGHDIYVDYHDLEWGVPLHDEQQLFEFLILEGAQAGLSWLTILQKRENYRAAFDQFVPEVVAAYTDDQLEALRHNPGIVRNRLKIKAARTNAQAFLRIQEEFGSFDQYIWRFVDGKPQINHFKSMAEVPATTPTSDAMAKDLKKRGFKFVGSTICYAFMQATGMVNDHTTDCFRHAELS